jgi:hypothetical protein
MRLFVATVIALFAFTAEPASALSVPEFSVITGFNASKYSRYSTHVESRPGVQWGARASMNVWQRLHVSAGLQVARRSARITNEWWLARDRDFGVTYFSEPDPVPPHDVGILFLEVPVIIHVPLWHERLYGIGGIAPTIRIRGDGYIARSPFPGGVNFRPYTGRFGVNWIAGGGIILPERFEHVRIEAQYEEGLTNAIELFGRIRSVSMNVVMRL